MARKIVASSRYQVPVRGFTQAVEAPAGGRLLFVSGLTARRADGTIVGEGDIHAQTRQVYENLRLILAEVGGTLDDVVRTTTYLRRMEDQAAMHEVQPGARAAWLEGDLDGRAAGAHRGTRRLPAPGEHDPAVRDDLEVLAAR